MRAAFAFSESGHHSDWGAVIEEIAISFEQKINAGSSLRDQRRLQAAAGEVRRLGRVGMVTPPEGRA